MYDKNVSKETNCQTHFTGAPVHLLLQRRQLQHGARPRELDRTNRGRQPPRGMCRPETTGRGAGGRSLETHLQQVLLALEHEANGGWDVDERGEEMWNTVMEILDDIKTGETAELLEG